MAQPPVASVALIVPRVVVVLVLIAGTPAITFDAAQSVQYAILKPGGQTHCSLGTDTCSGQPQMGGSSPMISWYRIGPDTQVEVSSQDTCGTRADKQARNGNIQDLRRLSVPKHWTADNYRESGECGFCQSLSLVPLSRRPLWYCLLVLSRPPGKRGSRGADVKGICARSTYGRR